LITCPEEQNTNWKHDPHPSFLHFRRGEMQKIHLPPWEGFGVIDRQPIRRPPVPSKPYIAITSAPPHRISLQKNTTIQNFYSKSLDKPKKACYNVGISKERTVNGHEAGTRTQ
jgi:hypothetical protein